MAKLLGRRGGEQTRSRLGRTHYRRIGKLGMAKRWGKQRQRANRSSSG
jgi:hypothetical protein